MLHPTHSHVESSDLLSEKQRCQRNSEEDPGGKYIFIYFYLTVIYLKDTGFITTWGSTDSKNAPIDLRKIYS